MQIRRETNADEPAVRGILQSAFVQSAEADLVDALRQKGDLAIAIVAEDGGRIIGYVALSWLRSPKGGLALAPVAVLPDDQGHGVGTALVAAALEAANQHGAAIVFVLGDPDFYARFGFTTDTTQFFPSAYSGPHFMAMWMGDHRVPSVPVRYADAFESLGA